MVKSLTVLGPRPSAPDDGVRLVAMYCGAPRGGCGGGKQARVARLVMTSKQKPATCGTCGSELKEAARSTTRRLLDAEIKRGLQG